MKVLTLPDQQDSVAVWPANGTAAVILQAENIIPGGATLQVNTITATDGQTEFLTSLPPGSAVMMFVNGVQYQQPVDFTVSGSDVTWLETDFALQAGDQVQLVYDSG